jgi:hypothetical protein
MQECSDTAGCIGNYAFNPWSPPMSCSLISPGW